MHKRSTDHLAKFEAAFQKYLDVYMTGRNLELLKDMLTDDFCGYGTGLDENFYQKTGGLEIFQRDIAQAPDRLHYTLHYHEIKLLDEFNAIVVTELDLKTMILGQDVKFNNLRMMMVLHEEDKLIKISGIHISFPTEVHDIDETFPLKELEKRTQVLSRMVEDKTISLQQAVSERQQAEENLKNLLNEYETVFQGTQDAMFLMYVLDENTFKYIRNNQIHAKASGFSAEDLEGKTPQELLGEEVGESIAANYRRCLNAAAPISYEETLDMPGGKKTWHTTLTPIFQHNKIVYIVGSAQDITERKQAELLLQESEGKQHQLAHYHRTLNKASIALTEAVTEDDVMAAISACMKELTGAFSVSVSIYDRQTKVLSLSYHSFNPAQTKELETLLGTGLFNLQWPISETQEEEMKAVIINKPASVSELTWGNVPPHLSEMIQAKLGVKGLTALTLHQNRNILGTAVAYLDKKIPEPPDEILHTFAYLAGLALSRKQTEKALLDSEEKYRFLVDHSHDLIWILRADGVFSYVSPSWKAILGYEPSYMIDRSFQPFVHAEDVTKCEAYMYKVIEAGKALPGPQYRVKHADGTWRWHEATCTPVFDSDGSFIYFVGVSRDVTERKQAEAEQAETLARFYGFAEASQYGMGMADLQGNIVFANQTLVRMLGEQSEEECLGKHFPTEYYSEAFFRKLTEEVLPVLMSQGEWRGELELKSKDGRTIPTEENYFVIKDKQGNPCYLADILTDIFDRKQAEESLRESEERARRQRSAIAGLVLDEAIVAVKLPEALERITAVLSAAVAVKRASVWLLSEDNSELKCLSLYEGGKGKHSSGTVLETSMFPRYFEAIYKENRIFVEDAQSDPRTSELTEGYLLPLGITSMLDAGIIMEGRLVGVICLEHTGTMRQWHPDEEAFISTVASIVAQLFASQERKQTEQKLADYALELEQLYHQLDSEINKARQLHERILLKSFPAIPGISFAAHYHPAQNLGGDFYDVIQKDNKLIFYLSDVSGHGLDGAMLSVFVKHTIKSYISFTPVDELTPATILRHLAEQHGREDHPEDLYVCVFMAVLDLDSMELSYCGAGFQDELLVSLGTGEKLKLAGQGMFISTYLPLEILELQEDRITLTPGSTIFCNTDGLTEQESNGAYYMDRFPDVFFQNAHQPAHLVAQAVVEDFRVFNNGSLQGGDDITFLVLKVDYLN